MKVVFNRNYRGGGTHSLTPARLAFTLAEVLITLGIIGVVAAITMPVLTSKIRNHELEVRFKRANTIVSQAIKLMENDIDGASINEVYCNSNADMKNFIEDLSKYFPGSYVDKESNHASDLGYKNSYWLTPNGKAGSPSYDDFGGMRTNELIIYSSGCANFAQRKMGFVVDSNGLAKPNRMGYDAFVYIINDNNSLNTVHGYFNYPEDNAKKNCDFSAESTSLGSSCINFALKDVFPNDDTKSYWKSLP